MGISILPIGGECPGMVNSWEELSEQSFVSVTIATSTLYCRITCCRAPILLLRLNALVTSSRRGLESIIGHERTGHPAGVAAHHAGHVVAQIRLISSGLQPLVGRGGSFPVFGHCVVEWR